jgi:hypothetical protein
MPAIRAEQQRRREAAEKAELERQRKQRVLRSATFKGQQPEFKGDYERPWSHGVPEVAAEGPRVVSADSGASVTGAGGRVTAGADDAFAISPRGGVGGLARMLQEGRPVAQGGVVPAGYFPGRTGGGRGRGSQQPVPGRSAGDRYAQHLLRGGMPPELVQQLRSQYEAWKEDEMARSSLTPEADAAQ